MQKNARSGTAISTPTVLILPKTDAISADKFINMIRQFHEGMQAQSFYDGDASAAFSDSNVVKLCVLLWPTLFSITFIAMVSKICLQNG